MARWRPRIRNGAPDIPSNPRRLTTDPCNKVIRPHKPFTETTDADWELVRCVVLDGPLYLTRALIEPMIKNRYGRILFFVGDGAISARGSGRTHLSAAKMGLIGMARGLASEFAPHNIRVNVVSPGSIDTRRDHS